MNKSMADRKKKSKKIWIALGIISAIVLIVLTTVFFIFLRKPNYSYAQINDAFWISTHDGNNNQYVDINSRVHGKNLRKTAWFINLYNDYLIEKGKPLEDCLSLDEVLDFYSSENYKNGNPIINNLPKKIENYLSWYYGPFRKFPKLDEDLTEKEAMISYAMFNLGVYSERKYTQQLSDVEIDNYSDFYIGIYAFNKENPSEMITEDEIKMAMVGGPQEPLVRFGEWFVYKGGEDKLTYDYGCDLYVEYVNYCKDKYGYYSDDDPDISFYDMEPNEIKQFFEYLESM